MGIGEFNLKYNKGLLFTLQNLKELNKSDLKDQASINIFNMFNTNGDEKLDKSELNSLFDTMSEAASKNGNASIFDTAEAEKYVASASKNGQTLKELGVKVQDLFNFLGSLVKNEQNEQTMLTKNDNDFTYTMTLKDGFSEDSEGVLEWNADSLAKLRTIYPDAETAYLKNGKVVILNKAGESVCDRNGNPLEVDFKEHNQTFSEDLAEIMVLGHKASPLERLMHQAEIQNELERLNSLDTPSESYLELSCSIEFQNMDKKEQTEAMLKWTGEKFYKAKEQGDLSAMKEYLVEGFGLAFQKMDMASIGNTKISVEGFKDFLKTWSGLNAIVEQLDKAIDDGDVNNLSDAEKIWAFTKGVGDAVDSFIGTQGVAFIGTLSIAGEAAAAGGIGEAWAVATQAYFAYEGVGSVAEGVQVLENAETEEDYRQSGSMIGNGAIMMHGAYKSFKGALTGKLQAGLEVKKAVKEIKECKSIEEINELRENLSALPYSEVEIVAMDRTCISRISELSKEEGGIEGGKPKFGLEEDVIKKENTSKTETANNNTKITNDKILNINTKEELVTILKEKINNQKLLEELSNLSDKDFSTIKRAVTHTLDDWMSTENNINSIVEMLNTIKQHSKIKNRSLSDELNFIDKILSEPETPDSSLLIDCRVTYRIPNDLKSLDILETLLNLKATCDNPLLNIDNIITMAHDFKDISDINILVERLKAKNVDGTYKYSANDYERYDVDPQLKTKDLDTKKQKLIDDYKDYPETHNKLKQLLQNADEDMIKLIETAEAQCRCKDFNNPKEKVAKFLLSRLNELDPNYIKSEINYLLENVEDTELKNMINNAISNADNLTISQKIKKLKTIQNLLEMHNNLQGKSVSINSTYWKNYLDELAKDEPELAAKLRGKEVSTTKTNETQSESKTSDKVNQNSMSEKALNKLKQFKQKIKQGYSKALVALGLKLPSFDKYATEADVQQYMQEYYNYLKQELSESQKIEQFVEYCKTNKDEISDYLYNEVYLNSRNLTPEVKSKCSEISEKYGVKVFLESDINDTKATTILKSIDEELNKWKTASNAQAKMPPTLDLTITKSNYIDQESAYGQSISVGFSEWGHGAISINGQRCFDLKALRHEMTHTNDLKNMIKFNESDFVVKDEQGNIIAKKCKYYDEFVKIGIPEYHISYAYNNPMEFIAVASEGNLNLCSPEFKQVLIDFGMPEWRFDFTE